MLRIENLCLNRGVTPALCHIDADFHPARVAFIRGPSGAGKSSLLRTLAGLERSASGSITFRGAQWQSQSCWTPPWKRSIGFVPQDLGLWPHLSVTDHIVWALPRREGWTRNRRSARVAELLNIFALSHAARRYPASLSGGEQQRLAIARALARNPAVLLLDEPIAHLDPALRQHVSDLIMRLTRSHEVVTIWVEHDHACLEGGDVVMHKMRRGQLEEHVPGCVREVASER